MSERIGTHGGMRLKVNNWDECLRIGNIGERVTKNNFLTIFRPILVKYLYSNRYKFELNELIQKAGIDGETVLSLFKWEVKTRTKFYPDILLETYHSYGKQGWFFISKADIIAYLFLGKEEVYEKGFLLIMEKLRHYFTKEILEEYPEKKSKTNKMGAIWSTFNRAVPFRAFPPNSLISIPKLKNLKKIQQKSLNGFIKEKTHQEV